MKNLFKIWLSIFLGAAFCCCNSKKDGKDLKERVTAIKFGHHTRVTDSLSYELNLESFNSYRELVIKTEIIACNDSFPSLRIRNQNEIKSIGLSNSCSDDYACILIFQRNTFQIHNDSIIKGFLKFPIDSLYPLLKKDLENNGRDPYYSDNPDKLLIFISLHSNKLKKLPSILDKTTDAYRKITGKTDINIVLNEWIEKIPPPPPPEPPNIIGQPQRL